MSKFKNKAEAKEALGTAKEERKAAQSELRAFEKENSFEKGGDHSGNKKWAKLKATVDKKAQAEEAIKTAMQSLKSERTPRPSKYTYPADCVSAADKKKYRAKMRAAAKSGDKKAKKEKKGKEGKKEKSKKEKKAKEAVED